MRRLAVSGQHVAYRGMPASTPRRAHVRTSQDMRRSPAPACAAGTQPMTASTVAQLLLACLPSVSAHEPTVTAGTGTRRESLATELLTSQGPGPRRSEARVRLGSIQGKLLLLLLTRAAEDGPLADQFWTPSEGRPPASPGGAIPSQAAALDACPVAHGWKRVQSNTVPFRLAVLYAAPHGTARLLVSSVRRVRRRHVAGHH
jgi:hypothetical protein